MSESVAYKKRWRAVWPEDLLMYDFYQRHPEAKRVPYDLNSFQPPFVKRFALRQWSEMQAGKTKSEAHAALMRGEMGTEWRQLRKCASFCRIPGDNCFFAVARQSGLAFVMH